MSAILGLKWIEDPEDAIKLINELIEENGSPNEYLVAKAFLLADCGMFSELDRLLPSLNMSVDEEYRLAVECYYNLGYSQAKKIFQKLLQNNSCQEGTKYFFNGQVQELYILQAGVEYYLERIDMLEKCMPFNPKKFVPEQTYSCFVRGGNKLRQGHIVTVSFLSDEYLENNYKPFFSKTRDAEGTKYLIWKIDADKGIVYAFPVSEVGDSCMYRIPGENYYNFFPDRWIETITRVINISDIVTIDGTLTLGDFNNVLSSAYKNIVWRFKDDITPDYYKNFLKTMVDSRIKMIKPEFKVECVDFSKQVIRSFYIFDIDNERRVYRSIELGRNHGRDNVPVSRTIIELPMTTHFIWAKRVDEKSLLQYLQKFVASKVLATPCVNSGALNLSSLDNEESGSPEKRPNCAFSGKNVENPTGYAHEARTLTQNC